jgi:hypothetical protein
MNRENLAKAILRGLKAQAEANKRSFSSFLDINEECGIESVALYGSVDLRRLADSLLDYINPKDEQPLTIQGVESCAKTPIVRIVWGDGVVTYAHFTQEAEVVHAMGRETVPKRFGALTPEEAMAS